MGAPKKIPSASALRKAIDAYFAGITYIEPLTDAYDTGQRTAKGRPILEMRTICNSSGEPIMVTRYAVPPSRQGICLALGISKDTWENYRDQKKSHIYPGFYEVCAEAELRIEAYLTAELNARKGDVKGIIFNLQNNYGWKNNTDLTVHDSVEKYLQKLDDAGETPQL